MGKWEGKIKGYDQSNHYIGTYRALIEKQGEVLYKMSLSFDLNIHIERKHKLDPFLKEETIYSSSLVVLKRKFRAATLLKIKSRVTWRKNS